MNEPHEVNDAMRLRAGLQPILEQWHHPNIKHGELEVRAVAAYQQQFQTPISIRQIRRLIQRTLKRDAGNRRFDRLMLYEQTEQPAWLGDVLEQAKFKNGDCPTLHEIDGFLDLVGDEYDQLVADGVPHKRAMRDIAAALALGAPWLSASRSALTKRLSRHFADRERKRKPRPVVTHDQAQLDLVKYKAGTRTEGGLPQALRELDEQGLIHDPQIRRGLDTRTSKSYLRKSLREALSDVPWWRVRHVLGSRKSRQMRAKVELTYDGIFSMTALCGDDMTGCFRMAVEDGCGWFRLIQPQILAVIDFRSLKALAWTTIPAEQYTALNARTVYLTGMRKYGVPRFIQREGMLWRNSMLFNSLAAIGTGQTSDAPFLARKVKATPSESPFSALEVARRLRIGGVRMVSNAAADRMGLAFDEPADEVEAAITFRESYSPNSKPIELVWNRWQHIAASRIGPDHGFCGRNERYDRPAIVSENISLVERKKLQPHEAGFYYLEGAVDAVNRIFEEYNRTPQEGRRLRHPSTGGPMSPNEAFEVFKNVKDPPAPISADVDMLFSNLKIETQVKNPNLRRRQFTSGTITVRGNIYCVEKSGLRPGQKLFAFFNPLAPEACTFTDRNMRNPITLPRLESPNALFQDGNTEISRRRVNQTHGALNAVYTAAQSQYEPLLRSAVVAPATRELNAQLHDGPKRLKVEQAQKKAARRKAKTVAARAGIPDAFTASNSAEDLMQLADDLKILEADNE